MLSLPENCYLNFIKFKSQIIWHNNSPYIKSTHEPVNIYWIGFKYLNKPKL